MSVIFPLNTAREPGRIPGKPFSTRRPLPPTAVSGPFQGRFRAVSALADTIGMSLGPRGEVVIVVLDDGSKEMEITLINCQADKPDEAACHHVP